MKYNLVKKDGKIIQEHKAIFKLKLNMKPYLIIVFIIFGISFGGFYGI